MAEINFNENFRERIIKALPIKTETLRLKGVPMGSLAQEFGFDVGDTNGSDIDWSSEFEYGGNLYEIWGSGKRGTANIELKQ